MSQVKLIVASGKQIIDKTTYFWYKKAETHTLVQQHISAQKYGTVGRPDKTQISYDLRLMHGTYCI